jgi:hypothetical protein
MKKGGNMKIKSDVNICRIRIMPTSCIASALCPENLAMSKPDCTNTMNMYMAIERIKPASKTISRVISLLKKDLSENPNMIVFFTNI